MGCGSSAPASSAHVASGASATAPLLQAAAAHASSPAPGSAAPPPAPPHSESAADGLTQPPVADDVMSVVSRTAAKGVAPVLALMMANEDDYVYQMWCCDALAGLCAGNGVCARAWRQ